MKLSVSILSMLNDKDIKEKIIKLNNCSLDYLHLDIMDGKFVSNKTWDLKQMMDIIPPEHKNLDVHLMVTDVLKYVNDFSLLNPEYITFHLEATNEVVKIIDIIKNKNIKVGISVKPNTNLNLLIPYLELIDLVLIMSVEPGKGGQKFLEETTEKIEYLYNLRKENNYNYVIEVDGGVNDMTISYCKKCDVIVVGSYITNNDYEKSITTLRKLSN